MHAEPSLVGAARQDWVGQRMERLEDDALLNGRGAYADDLGTRPGTLHAAVLRSPHPHARLLGIHARTLHRRLQAEGRTFEDIRDEVRRTVVAHYLAQSDAALSDITEWLSYSEPTAFSRACRRWFGAAPREVRRSSRSPGEDG